MNLEKFLGISKEIIDEIINNKYKYYNSYKILKKDGTFRWINAPRKELKNIQRIILYNFLYNWSAHPIAHGFIFKRSPKTMAEVHLGAKVIIKFDLKNFFWNITSTQVYNLLQFLCKKSKLKITPEELKILTELLTYKDRVPQGPVTSPALSNLICLNLDKELKKLMKQNPQSCVTRYADDIVFSSKEYISSEDIKLIIKQMWAIIHSRKFYINTKKICVKRFNKRMTVTGVVINTKLNVRKEYRYNLRAQLHNYFKQEKILTKKEYQKIKGKIAWIASLNCLQGERLMQQLGKIKLEN